jgi:hypothetical protein
VCACMFARMCVGGSVRGVCEAASPLHAWRVCCTHARENIKMRESKRDCCHRTLSGCFSQSIVGCFVKLAKGAKTKIIFDVLCGLTFARMDGWMDARTESAFKIMN